MSTTPLHRSAYGVDFFDPRQFTSSKDTQDALIALAGYLNKDNFTRVLGELLPEQALAIELILSGLPDDVPLSVWIIEIFPETFSEYDASIASKILHRLSLFFLFNRLPIDNDLFSQCHRDVEATPKLLSAISLLHFGDDQPENEVEEDVDPIPHFFKIKSKGQKKRSRQVTCASTSKTDTKIFTDFSYTIPQNPEEAEEVRSQVIAHAKLILQLFLTTLRAPDVVDYVQQTFLASNEPLSLVEIPTPEVALDKTAAVEAMNVPSAYPFIQPMKSALHFNSVKGFGEWRILISTRADKDLREARRRDRKTFEITVKKIRELSKGYFSDDNQKRLNGPKTDVPIFEAKMTRDTRLVYQVDSISDYDSQSDQVERQALRIFGIYTHAQLDNRLWESIGRQLGNKGKEYRRRCIHRERAAGTNDNVFRPASFPPLETERAEIPTGLDLPPDDLEQIHALLVLEKYLMFSQELLHSILADLDVAFPFQVSSQERAIIEHPQSCYVLGRSGTGKTTTMLFKMLWVERTYQMNSDDVSKPRQIFVTKSRVLAGKVEEYFMKLLESLKVASQSRENLQKLVLAKRNQADEDNLVDLDDEDNWRSDLPRKFSELQDFHFPLFLTFDRLCDLIEADFDASERGYSRRDNQEPRTYISYELFENHYWPHFSQRLIKGLGIIKGSESTTLSDHGYLDRKTYEELSERTQSTFATQRSTIYSIFEAYQVQRRQQGDYDAADRAHGILRVFNTPDRGVQGRKIDHLYVDEAQDNLLIDALLLRSLCHNKDGLFWAGDTAQTISVGSAFRFDDLKAFLFRVEKNRSERWKSFVNRSQSAPKTFQLATNYRSHSGIVNCAQSVIELITRFWPYSIDNLAPEKGIVDGLKPVFLNGWNDDNVRYEQFLFGSSGSHIEFGAQQCILVRDESARRKLQEQVGDIGLIMTLYDSKGLEFNDVLLFNFFEDSTVELSQWRLLLTVVNPMEPTDDPNRVAAPQFDRIRHASICAELKFLYVAITRARKNLWIADQSSKGEPMREFWTRRDLIHNCTPGTDMPRLAVSSSREEWASKGKELFERKKFFQAKHCYERASMLREMAIANAYYLRGEARKVPSGDSRHLKEQRHHAFVTAAEAFADCAREAPGKNRSVYFRCAAECLVQGAEELRAAKTYLEACEYDDAAKLFRKLGRFDEAVDVIKNHEEHMQSDVVENIKEVARLFYFREESFAKARDLFTTDEEQLEYLEDLDLGAARAELLVSLGRPAEAAALHLAEGRTQEAIPLFLQDGQSKDSMCQACICILRGLRDNVSYGIVPDKDRILQLMDWSNRLNANLIDLNDFNEISMFKAIIACDEFNLAKLAHIFLETNNTPAAALCLYHYFRVFPQIMTVTSEALAEILQLFLAYVRLLYEFAYQLDPRVVPSIQTLFAIRHTSLDDFFIPAGTFLYDNLINFRRREIPSDGLPISGWELCQTLRHALRKQLRTQITEQTYQCRHAVQFSPCLTYNTFGYCKRIQCPQEHISPISVSKMWYNMRVRLNLQQVLILQVLHSTGAVPFEDTRRQKRVYIRRLYESFNPPFVYLGAQSLLDSDMIPEFRRGIQVVKEWLRDIAFILDINPQVQFLTDMLRISNMALTFDSREALKYLSRAPFLSQSSAIKPFLRGPHEVFILPELLGSLDGIPEWSISAGFTSFCHIIYSRLPINISDVCTFVEYLCAACVISFKLYRRASLHGITLPRSWLLRHLSRPESVRVKRLPPYFYFMSHIAVLLETIYTGIGADYLLFGDSNLATIPNVRGVFIARICYALCLLGYNIPGPEESLRNNILRTLTSINRMDRRIPQLCQPYVYAQSWADLVRTLRGMSQGLLDELIQLHDLGREAVTFRPPRGVRIIPFKANEDLLQLLGASSFSVETASADPKTLEQDHATPTPEVQDLNVNDGDDLAELDEPEGPHEEGIDGTAESGDDGFGDEPLPVIISADMPQAQPPSEDEQRAALAILSMYRRIRNRRGDSSESKARSRITKMFVACLEQSHKIKKTSYRVVFLGPLPHLLASLEVALATTADQKKSIKKRLLEDHHEKLDYNRNRTTELVKLYKSLTRLQKVLAPASELHCRCDMAELRTIVTEAVELLRQTIPFSAPELKRNVDIAVKGILTTKKPPKSAPKPDLVWEEDSEGVY